MEVKAFGIDVVLGEAQVVAKLTGVSLQPII